jgi:alpha-N-arabinofuranosidase
LSERPATTSPFGYPSSRGMGYLEFLQWTEDLHMEPVLGVDDGYAREADGSEMVKAGAPLQPYVQDALDQIEYAMGDVSTPWGARRARDGRPAPFKLHFVEIGNEDVDPDYDARFSQFYDAIKARYPAIQIIACGQIKDTGSRPEDMNYRKSGQVKSRVPDVLDEHFYQTAKDAFSEVTRFDHYDRKGPKIFVGEWATMEGGPATPNMLGALGDAAWMIGMERNSDVVIMQAYAPLFANVNKGAFEWRTNLIGYDALNSYGSPAYYAQVMFNTHRGDEVLATTSTAESGFFTSVTRDSKTKAIYLKVVNVSGGPQTLKIEITGGAKIKPDGKVIELIGKPEDTNSIQEPTKVLPVEHGTSDLSTAFEHTFPQDSITVIALQAH